MKYVKNSLMSGCVILWMIGSWILIQAYINDIFMVRRNLLVFLVNFSLFSFWIAFSLGREIYITSKQTNKKKHQQSQQISSPAKFDLSISLVMIFLKTFLIVGALWSMIFIIRLVEAYTTPIDLILLSLPYGGFTLIWIQEIINQLMSYAKKQRFPHISWHSTSNGVALIMVMLFGMLLVNTFSFHGTWMEGVSYQSLFQNGDQLGREYRIPSAIVLPGDVILAFCESRAENRLDYGDIDLVMRRSLDGGASWGDIITLIDAGEHTAGNPCPVFDNDTNTLWLPYCIDNKQVFLINSSDFGETWSDPHEITQEIGLELSGSSHPHDMEYGTGPGIGIQLSSGRLIIPSYYFDQRGSHVIYSDDHGHSWHKGEDVNNGGECQAFQATNGDLHLSCRTPQGYRLKAISNDEGMTWETIRYEEQLEDVGCMASILQSKKIFENNSSALFYCHPTQNIRGFLTLRISFDQGETWGENYVIYDGPAAYSQLAILSNGTIAILFEQGSYDYHENIVWATISPVFFQNNVFYIFHSF